MLAGEQAFAGRRYLHSKIAFWNTGTGRGLILEMVSPAGLERYFANALDLFRGGMLPTPEATNRLPTGSEPGPRGKSVSVSRPRQSKNAMMITVLGHGRRPCLRP
jgi:hypothetical protein